MGLGIRDVIKQRYGRVKAGFAHRSLYVPEEERYDAWLPASEHGDRNGSAIRAIYGGGQDFPMYAAAGIAGAVTNEVHGKFKVTTDGAAAAIVQGATGLNITTGAGSGDDCIFKSVEQVTPAAFKTHKAVAKFQVDSIALTKFALLLGVDSNDPINTPTSDYTGIWHDTGDGVLLGKAYGDSGTVRSDTTDTLPTIANATDYEMEVCFILRDTAATSLGWFAVNGTKYRMSANQLTQIFRFLTTAPTNFCAMLAFRTGSAVSRTPIVKKLDFFVEN